jgi:hypothetical protein
MQRDQVDSVAPVCWSHPRGRAELFDVARCLTGVRGQLLEREEGADAHDVPRKPAFVCPWLVKEKISKNEDKLAKSRALSKKGRW